MESHVAFVERDVELYKEFSTARNRRISRSISRPNKGIDKVTVLVTGLRPPASGSGDPNQRTQGEQLHAYVIGGKQTFDENSASKIPGFLTENVKQESNLLVM
jgi:hypothetical protein